MPQSSIAALASFASWVLAYTFSLLCAAAMAAVWAKSRDRRVSGFLLILANMILTSAVSMALTVFVDFGFAYQVVLLNVLALYNLSVPVYVFACQNRLDRMKPLVAIVYVASALAANAVFLATGSAFVLSFAPLATLVYIPFWSRKPHARLDSGGTRGGKDEKAATKLFDSIERVGLLSLAVIVVMASAFALVNIARIPVPLIFYQAWFAWTTILYLVPPFAFATRSILRTYGRSGGNALKTGEGIKNGGSVTKAGEGGKDGVGIDAFAAACDARSFSSREREVAALICEGLTYKEVAEKLFVSLSTVKKHTNSIYQKAGVRNNRELMNALERG